MSFMDVYMIVPSAFASGLIWLVLIAIGLYIARDPAHQVISSLTRVLHNGLRLSAKAVSRAEKMMVQRNREVLLAQGREATERMVEREFERIDSIVRRDLGEYPALHRKLSEEITRIDEDYQQSAEVPPDPPGWIKAVDAVAKIPAKGDPVVSRILEDIHRSLDKATSDVIDQSRKSSRERHKILQELMPHWRKVNKSLGEVNTNVDSLLTRSKAIDRHMDEYENINRGTDRALRTLSSSSITQFFVSAFVLAIAVGGAAINFNLIATPMSEMVGGTSRIMGHPVSNIAAMVIILVEISMGLFLMESMRITRLFPIIGALNDKVRVRMIIVFFCILTSLALIEAGLAFIREILMEDELRTSAALAGQAAAGTETTNEFLWISTVAQMGLGFVLPFALMFVAIPLESFVHSLRTVLGLIGIGTLRTMAWLLRLFGNMMKFLSNSIIHVYDLVIFAPLWIERVIKHKAAKEDAVDTASAF